MSRQRTELIESLQHIRPELDKKYGIEIFGLIGSWARDEAEAASDIDIVFRIIDGRDVNLIHLGGAWTLLNEKLGRDIDLIAWDSVEQRYKDFMEKDLVRFYG